VKEPGTHAIAFPLSLSLSLCLSLGGVFRSRIFQELSGKRNGNKHAHPRISLKRRISIPDLNSLLLQSNSTQCQVRGIGRVRARGTGPDEKGLLTGTLDPEEDSTSPD